MIEAAPRARLSTFDAERRPPVLLYLTEAEERAGLGIALSLKSAMRCRLFAYCFRQPGATLPEELRSARYGAVVGTEADRAIRHLVTSASTGAQTPIEALPSTPEATAERIARTRESVADALVLISWFPGGVHPSTADARLACAGHSGTVALLIDKPSPFREVCAISTTAAGSRTRSQLKSLAAALEWVAPTFRLPLRSITELHAAVADARVETLVLLDVGADGAFGWLDDHKGRLDAATPGPLLIILPSPPRRAGWIERIFGP